MSGALIVPAVAATPTSMPTLSQYVEAMADQLGSRLYSTISSTAVAGEPGRWVLVDDLKDDEKQRAQFSGGWVHMQNGALVGQDRRIRDEGYEGPSGALAVSRVFQVGTIPTNPSADDLVQITDTLPWNQVGMVHGLTNFANEGLERVWVPARIPLVGNGTRLYNLSAYSHITSEDWINGVYDWNGQVTTTWPSMRVPWESKLTVRGATITLETAIVYGTTTPFELDIFVPGNRLVYDAVTNAWGYTTAGLVADGDQAAVPIPVMLPAAMKQALGYMIALVRRDKSLTKAERAERIAALSEDRLPWVIAAADITTTVLPRGTAPAAQGMLGGATNSTYPYGYFEQALVPSVVVP